MPSFSASAPGKVILFGEHAVVYGEPAVAVPVHSLKARAIVTPVIHGRRGKIQIEAPDIDLKVEMDDLEPDHPIRAAIRAAVLPDGDPSEIPACKIHLTSSIPIASGLGSGAAITAALIRALSAFLGQRLSDEAISDRTFEVEKIHHGTPSGIDNTVIAHQKPIYYQKGEPFQLLDIITPFSILIADSGIQSQTRDAVQMVRQNWLKAPNRYEEIFSSIGHITRQAREIILNGTPVELGPLMDQNHSLLMDLEVSHPDLDRLIGIARDAGALGAKLSGGGLGGNIIALVGEDPGRIIEDLSRAGVKNPLVTEINIQS
jgi:mevalonate kinase